MRTGVFKITNYVIDLLIRKLEDYEDMSIYGCDMAYTLLEQYNVDGSITYNTYEAIEWLKNNIHDIYDFLPTIKFEFGNEFYAKLCIDILDSPEKAMTIICLEIANEILYNLDFIKKNWDNEIVLNSETIKIIKKELENYEN